MKRRVLTSKEIALQNLKHRPLRSICLVVFVSLLSFISFGGSILSNSLKNGVGSMQERLGADIMVVPKGAGSAIEGVLIGGKSSAFYFDGKIADEIASANGVSRVSPQYFFSSLSADCCSLPVQLIGFDPKTDFVIQPWVAQKIGGNLADGQLVIGSNVSANAGGTMKFFNQTYTVLAKLDKTSTGFDQSVFMNMNTAHEMLRNLKKVGYSTLTEGENDISAVMVDVKDGNDIKSIADSIQKEHKDTDVIISKNMYTGISESLGTLVSYIDIISISLWILVVIVLFIVFTMTGNERKKEFAIIRALGATRKKLIVIVLSEAALISMAGSIIGILIASIVVFPFNTYIGMKLQLPYLQPPVTSILLTAGISFLLSFAVGPLTAVYSAIKIGKSETYLTIREGE